MNLIFTQGFTTARELTDISGRGVGMNVVKTEVESLHGKIDIKSTRGKGTRFTIRIPLTLAIIDGMVIRTGEERFIIPTIAVVTTGKSDPKDITSLPGKNELIKIHGSLIPLFKLSALFKTKRCETGTENQLFIVVEENEKKIALLVDEFLGKQQIVIKSLGETMKNIPGIAGGAILSDGRVGLIADITSLVKLAHT
jgi:two-component system chemotaxis sensor kinase CheA